MHAMNRRCAFLHISDPKQRCKLFDSLVLPILSYASEVWAVDKKVGKSAEQLHWQFLKHILGVRGSTATLIVLAEFGRYPLRFHWWQQILQYHNRINNLPDDECLIQCAFVEGLHDQAYCFWSHNGRCYSYSIRIICWPLIFPHSKPSEAADLSADSDVVATVSMYLHRCIQVYTGQFKPVEQRVDTIRELRFCSVCATDIAQDVDEHHFVFGCPAYCSIRDRFTAIFWGPAPALFSSSLYMTTGSLPSFCKNILHTGLCC